MIIKYLASWGHAVILACYSCLLQFKIIKKHSFDIPVVSVGNIVLGGSGKTPFVLFLSRLLTQKNISHVIISRGYKKKIRGSVLVHDGKQCLVRSPDECGDEPFMLATQLKSVPIIVNEKKSLAIKLAIKRFNPKIIILDDGFQSRYIANKFNIVLFNLLDEQKDLFLFPFGKLREPIESLQRADVVVLTKKELANEQGSEHKRALLSFLKTKQIPCFSSHLHFNLLQYQRRESSGVVAPIKLDSLSSHYRLFGCCGIGDPRSFQLALRPFAKQVVVFRSFSDHYNYIERAVVFLDLLKELTQTHQINGLITTYKDFVKINSLGQDFNRWVAQNRFVFLVLDLELSLNSKDERTTMKMIKNLIL